MAHLFYVKESDTKAKVELIYNKIPDDNVISEIGMEFIIVDIIPDPEIIDHNNPVLYVNPTTNKVFYEYIGRALTNEERITELENLNAQLQSIIDQMLINDLEK